MPKALIIGFPAAMSLPWRLPGSVQLGSLYSEAGGRAPPQQPAKGPGARQSYQRRDLGGPDLGSQVRQRPRDLHWLCRRLFSDGEDSEAQV